MQQLLVEVADLKRRYREYIKNDNRLIGQEKASLVQELDDLIGAFFRLRQYVTPGNPVEFCSTETIDRHYFRVEVHTTTWSGEGKSYPWPLEEGEDFVDIHNDEILNNLRTLFVLYGEAASDGVITESETSGVLLQLDTVIFALLRAELLILRGSIS